MVGPRLTAWNSLYFLAGRDVGILPYFLPLLLGLAAFRRGEGRGMLILAALAAAACFLITRPFNFYGGGGAIANRYFLPVYPAFWFAAGPARARLAGRCWPRPCAAPFLLALWRQPRAYLLDAEQRLPLRLAAPPSRLLPYETTQSHLKPARRRGLQPGNASGSSRSRPASAPEADGALSGSAPTGQGETPGGQPQPLPGLRMIVDPPRRRGSPSPAPR